MEGMASAVGKGVYYVRPEGGLSRRADSERALRYFTFSKFCIRSW